MQSTYVMDSIEVIAAFRKGKIIPLAFNWRGERYQSFTVAKSWEKFDNNAKVLCYSLKLDRSYYEICFNTERLDWHLNKVLCFL